MKKGKMFLGLSALLVCVLVFSGCGLQEKIGESITEKIIESAAGDNVDVDLDGGSFTVSSEDGDYSYSEEDGSFTMESEDGSVVAGTDTEWPEGEAADYLPELKDGVISSFYNSSTSCMIWADELSQDVYKDYVDKIKDEGYTENTMVSSSTDMEMYYGEKTDGTTVSIAYMPEDQSIQIAIDITSIVNQ